MISKTLYLELVDGKKLADTQNGMNASGFQRIKATTIFQRNIATGVYDAFIYYDEDETYGKRLQQAQTELPKIIIPPTKPTMTLILPKAVDKEGFDLTIIEEMNISEEDEEDDE